MISPLIQSHCVFFLDFLLLPVCLEEVSPEEEQGSSPVQEEPELPHIKEEQEELLQRPGEAGGSMSSFAHMVTLTLH